MPKRPDASWVEDMKLRVFWADRGFFFINVLASSHSCQVPSSAPLSFKRWWWGNHFHRYCSHQKALINKANISKAAGKKMTWRRGWEMEIPGRLGKQFSSDLEAQGLVCVWERVSDDYLADREPRFKSMAREPPPPLHHRHLAICCLLQPSVFTSPPKTLQLPCDSHSFYPSVAQAATDTLSY